MITEDNISHNKVKIPVVQLLGQVLTPRHHQLRGSHHHLLDDTGMPTFKTDLPFLGSDLVTYTVSHVVILKADVCTNLTEFNLRTSLQYLQVEERSQMGNKVHLGAVLKADDRQLKKFDKYSTLLF